MDDELIYQYEQWREADAAGRDDDADAACQALFSECFDSPRFLE
jgi:hypothetical protein